MSDRLMILNGKFEVRRRLAAQNLKSCPLCGAINATSNPECFVCRWSGRFEKDPEVVQIGLDDLIDRCPELAESFLLEAANPIHRFLARLRRFFLRQRLDVRV